MSRITRWFVALAAVLVGSAMVASPASAAELDPPWTPFSHCPVDDLAMIGAPPTTYGAGCAASVAATGTFGIGSTVVDTGRIELQMGITGTADGGSLTVDATDGKTLQSDTVLVPGGLLGLDLGDTPLGRLLGKLVTNPPLGVKATVELVGTPSDFNAGAVLGAPGPVMTLPVRVHLQNLLLGGRCYIGSAQDPILLKPSLVSPPTDLTSGSFSGGFIIGMTASLGDDSFTVPAAKGCGPAGLLDKVVNAKLGLPTPAGANQLMLNDTRLSVALTQQGGQVLADAWHAAEQP